MRVLWFTSVTPPAVSVHLGTPKSVGPASWVESLRQALLRCPGAQLSIAAPCATIFEPFESDGVAYYALPLPEPSTRVGRAVSGWRSSFELDDMSAACDAAVRRDRPDLIHVHGTEGPFGLIGGRTELPVLISLQGLLTVYQRFYFRSKSARDIVGMAVSRDFATGRSAIQGYWRCVRMAQRERAIMRANTAFAGRTEWDKAVLWATNPTARYYHSDEVLRAPFYQHAWQPEAAAENTVFCTSNALTWKAAESLVEALGLLHRAGLRDVRVRIAGIAPDTHFYADRARRHGVTGSVSWLGRLSEEQLVRELLNATLFAYPSHIDNSPNALCEALLVGVPTIASYVGGVPSLMDDGRDGLLYPDDDPYALAGGIRRLLDDRAFASEAGRRARERALCRHDPDTIVAGLLEIYRQLLT